MAAAEKKQSLNRIIQFRREKLDRLRELGVNPYPYRFDVTHTSVQVREGFQELKESSVRVAGRIVSLRRMGKTAFFHLQDQSGRIQVYVKRETVGEKTFAVFGLMDIGDLVGVQGTVFTTQTGEISVSARTLDLLCKSLRPLPGTKKRGEESFHPFHGKEQRYRYRHLDLIVNPEVKEVFQKRARIITAVRRFLDNEGFTEVETPVLQPVYGGAFARPFKTTHHTLDRDLYLRVADELYLKRLIISGFDRVYELSKVFRNEGMDRLHNPEFTMLEFYIAYVDYLFLMDFTEKLIQKAADAVGLTAVKVDGKMVDLTLPFRRVSYMEVLGQAVGEDVSEADEATLRQLAGEHGVDVGVEDHLGRLYEVLMAQLVEPGLVNPTFVLDYPKAISPLAKTHRNGDRNLVERFELFIGGRELANSFTELNDPIDQRKRFENQVELRKKGDDQAQALDEDFLRAVEVGMPPTGGVGVGIDRLVMLLTGQRSIKDVILFPAMRPESDD
ncbi:MAG: lysine--tRNA ligase [Fidelibacterota bacterium]